ncbi:F-box protein [Phanerochaete sordida]|uniref:F-box protein n=1 Tax=Phanerochaete sordida TaxID=48140 RepID=A0A9P3GK57_9APHY|nr:F-box protein [Phanerochaete sordida]
MNTVPKESQPRLPTLKKRPRGLRRAAETSHLTPIACKLPPEVLSRSFAAYRDMYLDDAELTRYEIYLPLLHVCRRWRSVLLKDPALWTSITLPACPRYVMLALECSKGLALDVFAYDISLRSREDAVQWEWLPILENIHRIRKLHLLSIPDVAAVKQVRAFDAPRLRELVIRPPGRGLRMDPDVIRFFLNVLDQSPPLEILGLQVFSTKICLPVSRLSSLRKLGLDHLDSSDGRAIAIPRVLDTLRHLSGLEELYLGCYFSHPDALDASIEVELPRLVALDVAFVPGTPTVLKYLRFPATTRIFIAAYGSLAKATEVEPLLDELRELIPTLTRGCPVSGLCLGTRTMDSTCVARPDGEIFQTQFWTTREPDGETLPRFVVSFNDDSFTPLIVRQLFCHLPLAEVSEIHVWPALADGSGVTIDPTVVADLARYCPNLTVLALSVSSPQWTMEVLVPRDGELPVFEAALTLELRFPALHTWDCRAAGTREPCNSPYCMHHIVQMLERRHERGNPVARLWAYPRFLSTTCSRCAGSSPAEYTKRTSRLRRTWRTRRIASRTICCCLRRRTGTTTAFEDLLDW